MEQKVYKAGILMLFLALLFQQSFAQDLPFTPKKPDTDQQKNYQQQMKELQQNMRDLHKQMSDLQRQHIQKNLKLNTDLLKSLNFKRLDSLQNFVWADSLRSLSYNLSNSLSSNIGSINGWNSGDVMINGETSNRRFQQEKMIEKTKTFSKSYPADKNDKLTVDNHYGRVTVNTWNKNEFKVDVEIKVATDEEAETQKLLDAVEIVTSQDQAGASFKTVIPERSSNNSFFGFSTTNDHRRININYTVFMPVKSALDINNRYGSIILPDLDGPVKINNSYGNFTAKELNNNENALKINYGNADIESLNGGELKLNYGHLKIGTATNLNAIVGYSPVSIDRLKSAANIKVNYGSGLTIGNLDKNVKNLDIDANFTKISLDLNGSENFLFDVTVRYNRFTHNDNFVKVTDQPDEDGHYSSTKNYKGYVGKSGSDNKVTIRSNYSGVSFN